MHRDPMPVTKRDAKGGMPIAIGAFAGAAFGGLAIGAALGTALGAAAGAAFGGAAVAYGVDALRSGRG